MSDDDVYGRSDGPSRRRILLSAAMGASAVIVSGCASSRREPMSGEAGSEQGAKEVTANEDLMREHGVLRRALLVYRESAVRLRTAPSSVSPGALAQTARLFRTFGEDYHERALEEAYVFPTVRQAGGGAASYPDVLTRQHERGRAITDYILSVTERGRIGTGDAAPLAQTLDAMVTMYQNHTAREDTVVFPAWKAALSEDQYKELSERFEDIEKRQFGSDAFESAVAQMDEVERVLGFSNLDQFTAPPPPTRVSAL